MKHCTRCQAEKATSEFCRKAKAPDGLNAWCKDCHRAYMRVRPNPTYAVKRDWWIAYYRGNPNKVRARGAVKRAVKRGDLRRITLCVCVDCGHPAERYDHFLGYEPEHWLDVQAVCAECDGRRERQRPRVSKYRHGPQPFVEPRGVPQPDRRYSL